MKRDGWRITAFVLLIASVFGAIGPAVAQVSAYKAAEQVHWASAAFFGTGWYSVDENRQAFIFRIPPRQRLRASGWDAQGGRISGIEILYPVALGLHRIDDIPDFLEFDNYGTITFTPGVQVEIPVSERWYLRPYAHFGFGYEQTQGEWARIWYGGLRSRYSVVESQSFSLNLLNEMALAGYKPEFKSRGQYGQVMAGLEFSHAMNTPDVSTGPWYLNGHLTYSWLFDELNFHVAPEEVVSIQDEWEVGLALGRGRAGVKIGFLEFEQVGFSFKFSSNGDYQAITVNFRSPFTM